MHYTDSSAIIVPGNSSHRQADRQTDRHYNYMHCVWFGTPWVVINNKTEEGTGLANTSRKGNKISQ